MRHFYCDLDNTLIYSYKRDIGDQKIPVEEYQGRENSFMTKTSHELLGNIKEYLRMIPTTTRSLAQYQRIQLGVGEFSLALVANGGLLLRNGEVDLPWQEESLQLLASYCPKMEEIAENLQKSGEISSEIRWVDDLFLFGKSPNAEALAEELGKTLDSGLDVQTNGEKLYILPKTLSKGRAIQRLEARFGGSQVFVAGDSLFDCSMFGQAHLGFAPEGLRKHLKETDLVWFCPETVLFSEGLLQELHSICQKEPDV